jgi:hypothetical protein
MNTEQRCCPQMEKPGRGFASVAALCPDLHRFSSIRKTGNEEKGIEASCVPAFLIRLLRRGSIRYPAKSSSLAKVMVAAIDLNRPKSVCLRPTGRFR